MVFFMSRRIEMSRNHIVLFEPRIPQNTFGVFIAGHRSSLDMVAGVLIAARLLEQTLGDSSKIFSILVIVKIVLSHQTS